jgi:hypothetical protein
VAFFPGVEEAGASSTRTGEMAIVRGDVRIIHPLESREATCEIKMRKAPPFAAQRMGHSGLHMAQPDRRSHSRRSPESRTVAAVLALNERARERWGETFLCSTYGHSPV